MTHDPSHRLATAEEIMNGKNPFEKVSTPLGEMERWRAEAMLIGTMGGIRSVYDIIRSDAVEAAARADAEEARTTLIKHVCERVDALAARVDAFASELEAFKAKERADAEAAAQAEEERRRQLEEDPLEDPPDIAEYQARNPPSEIEDEEHQPGGELHTVAPKEDPEPDLEVEDDQGTLPNELQEGVPPAPSNYPNPELPKPPVVSQPVSISLNKE